MAGVPASADFAPPTCACPICRGECKRHSTYTRRIKDIGIDGPIVLEVPVGNYRCPECRKFFKPELPFAGKSRRYTDRAVRKATVAIQEDKTTYTALPRRLDRDFCVRPAKSTGWAWFQRFAGSIDIGDYLRWACSRFSGQLSVDSVQDGDIQMWFATDPLNKDLILGYHRAEHADTTSLTTFLTSLRDTYGIRPEIFTGDDASVFDTVPEQVWHGVSIQLCHFHVIKNLNYNYLRKSLRDRMTAGKPEKPKRPEKPRKRTRGPMTPGEQKTWQLRMEWYARDMERYLRDKERYDRDNEEWTEAYRKRRLLFRTTRNLAKAKSIKAKEAEFIAETCKRYPAVDTFRAFLLDFYDIMDSKDAAAAELLRRAFLVKWADESEGDPYIRHVLQQFGDDHWFGKLFPFTRFENAHRTTNSTERANRWFRKRQKTHYRNRTEGTIRNMLHADLVYRKDRTPTDEPPVRLVRRAAMLQQTG